MKWVVEWKIIHQPRVCKDASELYQDEQLSFYSRQFYEHQNKKWEFLIIGNKILDETNSIFSDGHWHHPLEPLIFVFLKNIQIIWCWMYIIWRYIICGDADWSKSYQYDKAECSLLQKCLWEFKTKESS